MLTYQITPKLAVPNGLLLGRLATVHNVPLAASHAAIPIKVEAKSHAATTVDHDGPVVRLIIDIGQSLYNDALRAAMVDWGFSFHFA